MGQTIPGSEDFPDQSAWSDWSLTRLRPDKPSAPDLARSGASVGNTAAQTRAFRPVPLPCLFASRLATTPAARLGTPSNNTRTWCRSSLFLLVGLPVCFSQLTLQEGARTPHLPQVRRTCELLRVQASRYFRATGERSLFGAM
jgi:hypothetical protein